MLVLEAMLAPLIVAQTVSQLAAGVTFTPAEVAGPMVGFVAVAAAALWFLIGLLRTLDTAAPAGRAGALHADAVVVGGLQ
jgi:hypothetical protein